MIRVRCQCTVAIPPAEGWDIWEDCTVDVTTVSDLRAVNYATYNPHDGPPEAQWHTVHVHKDHVFMFEALNVRHNVYEVVIDDS